VCPVDRNGEISVNKRTEIENQYGKNANITITRSLAGETPVIRSTVHLHVAFLALVSILFVSQAHSALFPIMGGTMVYDDDRDITWLADANYAQTSGFDVNGAMSWTDALSWADNLIYGGLDDWRLPTAMESGGGAQPCPEPGSEFGYTCTNSELGNMFYTVLGGSKDNALSTSHNANYDLFSNIQDGIYRFAEEDIESSLNSWIFRFDQFGGLQGGGLRNASFYSWAVMDGNALSAVPLPAGIWLFGSGLIGLFGFARKNK